MANINPNRVVPGSLALTGMDVQLPGCDGIEAFERLIYAGGQAGAAAGLNDRQPLEWLEKSIWRAWRDAGFERAQATRIALLVAGLPGPETRLATAALGHKLVVQDLSGQSNPLPAALEQAQALISAGWDAVIIAACSDGESAPVVVQPEQHAAFGMGFDRGIHDWRLGAGAGAVVMMDHARAVREGRRVYAVVQGLQMVPGRGPNGVTHPLPVPPVLDDVRSCCQGALQQAGVNPVEVGYLEFFGSGNDAVDGVEIAGVCQSYRQPGGDLTCALGSAQANSGYLFAASGLIGLIRSALCLTGRFLPQVPAWTSPKLPALWRGAPFYAPVQSTPWFTRLDCPRRLAGLNLLGLYGSFAHLILAEALPQESAEPRQDTGSLARGLHLIPLAVDSIEALIAELEELQAAMACSPDLFALGAEWQAAAAENERAKYGLAIVGSSHEELNREVELALKAVPLAFEKGSDWQTPLGSYFTAAPVGHEGEVAFVYPGAFNSYPWVGKDLFHLFPWLFDRSVGRTQELGRVMRECQLYPRTLSAPGKEEQAAQEAQLLADPVAMLMSGTTIAILFTYILRETLGIRPAATFGYSLGENSMMFASQVWQEGDATATALESSPLFHERLAGPQLAIRAAWSLPAEGETADGGPLWNNYLVMATPDAVQAQVAKEQRVYITHINTPRQVVIGGDPQACQRVIAALRCPSLQAPFDYAMHCAPTVSEQPALTNLHNWPLECSPPWRMYSAADYQPLVLDPPHSQRQVVAGQMAKMLCSPLDFPRLVQRVYADGARVFIEVGAGGNCARWVSECLKGEPHLALSVNRRGTDDYASLVRLAARLFAHRVPLDLSRFYLPQAVRMAR